MGYYPNNGGRRNYSATYRAQGAFCQSCRRPFTPRQLMDGNFSRTCGAPACVSASQRYSQAQMSRPMNRY